MGVMGTGLLFQIMVLMAWTALCVSYVISVAGRVLARKRDEK